MLEIRKDTVRQVERSSLLGEPVMAIPIEVDENEKQTDAAHELHRLSQTPQVVFLLHKNVRYYGTPVRTGAFWCSGYDMILSDTARFAACRFLFPLHRPSALPGWMMTRSSTMSINIVRLIKPVAMAYRNGSGTWQSKPSMAVFIT